MKMYIIDQDEEQYSILYSLSDNSQWQICYLMTKVLLDKKKILTKFL